MGPWSTRLGLWARANQESEVRGMEANRRVWRDVTSVEALPKRNEKLPNKTSAFPVLERLEPHQFGV